MPRPRKAERTIDLHVMVPKPLHKKMMDYLRKEGSGFVGFGAKQRFITKLMSEFFAAQGIKNPRIDYSWEE